MKIESEIVYRLPISRDEMYIRGLFQALDIKEYYKKGVAKMFDTNKIEEFYANVKAKREEAVAVALLDKDAKVAEAFELAKEEIARKVEADLIANAEAPFKHDIELCERFLVEENEEVVEENETTEGEI